MTSKLNGRAPHSTKKPPSGASYFGRVFAREWALVLLLIFGGCCSNVYTLELLVTQQPKSGNLITLFQFLIVAIEGLFSNLEWRKRAAWPIGLKPRVIPIQYWCQMVVLFWTVSVLNNYALGFRISMPLHIIFRSGSLFVSMVLSWSFFGKSFSRQQVLGVLLVSAGVVTATYHSYATPTKADTSSSSPSASPVPLAEWLAGLGILTLALILSCFLGQLQQITYAKYGPQWREGLFYTHLLGLPGFLLFYGDMKRQVIAYNGSPVVTLGDTLRPYAASWIPSAIWEVVASGGIGSIRIPSMWLYLAMNTATQYVCISGVHRLSSMASSVTLNLILSIRKFISLLISVLIFDNEFTIGHWIGTTAVFLGAAVYTMSSSKPKPPDKTKVQ